MIILGIRWIYYVVVNWLNSDAALQAGAVIADWTMYAGALVIGMIGLGYILRSPSGSNGNRNGGNGIMAIVIGAIVGAIGAFLTGLVRMLFRFLRGTYFETRDSLVDYGWKRLWANLVAIIVIIIII